LAARGTSDLGTDPSLASSGASASIMGGGSATAPRSGTDSTLSSNLFRGEVLAHLTDSVKRLRPYLGAGLGWRSAKLQENAASTLYGGSQAGGSLHQNAFGALASAGTKLRIAKSVSLSFAFDYYLPLARQDARLEQPITAANAASPTSKLSSSDSFLTGSSQYQILGGVQYAF
jgi:opacity protein-like surface antigen